MSNTPSLPPCPFCGAPACGYPIEAHEHSSFLKNIVGVPDHRGSYVIEGNCACGSGLIGETEAEVTERWNRRTPQPVARESLKRVATIKSWTNGSYWRNYQVEWHSDALVEGTQLYAEIPAHGITQKGGG